MAIPNGKHKNSKFFYILVCQRAIPRTFNWYFICIKRRLNRNERKRRKKLLKSLKNANCVSYKNVPFELCGIQITRFSIRFHFEFTAFLMTSLFRFEKQNDIDDVRTCFLPIHFMCFFFLFIETRISYLDDLFMGWNWYAKQNSWIVMRKWKIIEVCKISRGQKRLKGTNLGFCIWSKFYFYEIQTKIKKNL